MKSKMFKFVKVLETYRDLVIVQFKEVIGVRDEFFFNPFEMGVGFKSVEEARHEIDKLMMQQTIGRCSKVVERWPNWKQNILEHSGQATGPRREPVDNGQEIY